MTSRDGPRARGTDGSDFTHRERVASHYKESVRWKAKLKACLSFHLVLVLLIGAWITAAYTGMANVEPQPWEVAWLLSAIPSAVGLWSLPKNNLRQLNAYAFGTVLTGVGPLAYGACIMLRDIFLNISLQRVPATEHWQRAPMKMAVVAFMIQFHGISLYFANKLIGAWKSKGEKKTS